MYWCNDGTDVGIANHPLQDGTHAWHGWVAKNLRQIGQGPKRKPNKMIVLLKEQSNKMTYKDIWLCLHISALVRHHREAASCSDGN